MSAKCWIFGDNISTDEILPARYMVVVDPEELAKHTMEGADPDFAKKMSPGDIIVAGDNFGYGSSREHAPVSLKAAGVGAIIAKSFARIFFRNCINLGLPVIFSPQAVADAGEGDMLQVDMEKREIRNLTKNSTYLFPEYPDFILEYLKKGGLINALNEKIDNQLTGGDSEKK